MLGPDEQFTIVSLSGDTPKKPHVLKILALQLGPRFSTDVVVVETADHARLSLKLSYNWRFDVDKNDEDQARSIFQVPDFIGDFCKAIASRVRGAIASQSFDDFHRGSAQIIRRAVFGVDDEGEIRDSLRFPSNNLVITNVDIQSVEPVDSKTRDALQKSVQLAIEITTK
jgi:major vault protein